MYKIWTDKPPLGSQINWGHPLSKGLCGAWLLNAIGKPVELVTNKKATTDNTTNVITRLGCGKKCATGQVNIEWDSEFIKTSDGAGTGDFTIIVTANPSAGTGAVQHLFAQKNDAGGAPYGQVAILADSTNGGYASGKVELFTYNNAGINCIGGDAQADGLYHSYVGIRKGTALYYSKDLGFQVSASGTVRDISMAPNARYTALGSRGNGTTESASCTIIRAMAWNRALTFQEIQSLYVSPYQFISRPSYRVYSAEEAPPEAGVVPLRMLMGVGV